MHGNVWEWTAISRNGSGFYPLRGGGFDFSAEGACSAFRVEFKPETKGGAISFRLVQEPSSTSPSQELEVVSPKVEDNSSRLGAHEPTRLATGYTTNRDSQKVLPGNWIGEYSGFAKDDSYRLDMELSIDKYENKQISGSLKFTGSHNSTLVVTGGLSSGPEVFAASRDWLSHLESEVSDNYLGTFFVVDHHQSGENLEQGGIYRFIYLHNDTIQGLWYRPYESTPIGKFLLSRKK